MNLTQQIAKQFKDVHFGENWTGVNLKEMTTLFSESLREDSLVL